MISIMAGRKTRFNMSQQAPRYNRRDIIIQQTECWYRYVNLILLRAAVSNMRPEQNDASEEVRERRIVKIEQRRYANGILPRAE